MSQSPLGRKGRDDSLDAGYREAEIKQLYEAQQAFREIAETYLSKTIRRLHGGLRTERQAKIQRELEHIESYATSEIDRLESFIDVYCKQQATGADLEIAIRGQEKRLANLQQRIDRRKENVKTKGRIVSLAPELVNWCYVLPPS